MTGVLDLASNTTHGMRDIIQSKSQDFYHRRHREPRTFYGENNYYQVYNEKDARLRNKLKKNKTMKESVLMIEQVNLWDDDLFICNNGIILQNKSKQLWIIKA